MKNESEFIVLHSSECPSLTMRSRLSYELGQDASQQVHIRVTRNTGRGYVKPAWVPLSALELLIRAEERFTRAAVLDLFRGTSINGAGFVMAVLRQEGVIEAVEEVRHAYRYLGSAALRERLDASAANDLSIPSPAGKPSSKRRNLSAPRAST